MQEEAYACDAGGTGGEACGGVVRCDSAEGEHGGGRGDAAGICECGEAAAGERLLAGEGLFKNGREEDEISEGFRLLDLSGGVAGDADEPWAGGMWADCREGCGLTLHEGSGGEVHAVDVGL